MQAVGWTAIRRMIGIPEESPTAAFDKNTRNVAAEVADFGDGSPYERRFADLAPEQRQALHSEVGPRLIALAAEHAGVRIMRSEPGQGGYMDRIAPDWQIRVLGSPEQIAAFSDFLGLGGQQTSVIHSRIHKSASGRAAIFTLPAGTTHESAATAWRELQRILPRLAEDGYSFVEAEGQRQMRGSLATRRERRASCVSGT